MKTMFREDMDEESYKEYMDYLEYKKYPLSTKNDDKAKEKINRNNWRRKCENKFFVKDGSLWYRQKEQRDLTRDKEQRDLTRDKEQRDLTRDKGLEVLRSADKLRTIASFHNPEAGVCRSMNKTREMLSKKYFWKGIQRDVMQYIRTSCPSCSNRRTTSPAGGNHATADSGRVDTISPDYCAAVTSVVADVHDESAAAVSHDPTRICYSQEVTQRRVYGRRCENGSL